MANTQKYLNHLLQGTGITPACSEEEREAADLIADVFRKHGFTPEVQEFNASGSAKVAQAVLGIAVFLGAVLAGVGGVIGVVGALLALAGAVIYFIERMGHPVLSRLGAGGLSQNVIAYHKASGPLASPRNRPVVVVAHYDSPRVDLMAQEPFAKYRPMMVKALPVCMAAPFVLVFIRVLPFSDGLKMLLWLVAIVVALVPLLESVSIIANRFVLPYATGTVCNKSSVAAMLGVMDEVAPFEGREEFPDDVPFEEYYAEQVRIAEEAAAAAEAERQAKEAAKQAKRGGAGAEPEPEPVSLDETPAPDEADAAEPIEKTAQFVEVEQTAVVEPIEEPTDGVFVEEEEPADEMHVAGDEEPAVPESELEPEPEPVVYPRLTIKGDVRFGEEIVRSLGMLPESCAIVYEDPVSEDGSSSGSAEDGEVWFGDGAQGEPEPIDVIDSIEADDFEQDEYEEDFETAPTVVERLRDGASRLISFVRTKTEHAEAAVDEAVTDGALTEDDGLLPLDDAGGDETETAADSSPEDGASAEEEQAEPELERTVERTAIVTEGDDEMPAVQLSDAAAPAAAETSDVPVETVDSLMAEISASVAPARTVAPRVINLPSIGSDPAVGGSSSTASRATLFDLPDPSVEPVDPFASYDSQEQSASAAATTQQSRGTRRRQDEGSLSEWLGVDSDFDAKTSGREIGSWANFDDDSSWKGGATSSSGAGEAALREAVASMGDDELLGHDIWFVAAGASENGNAGINAFLDEHRDKLRGVFLINLECVGAGQVAMIATEGKSRVLKGDRRIMGLVSKVSADFHHEFGSVEMPHLATDAYAAMSRSLRSLTIGGVDGAGFALSHSEDDQVYNVNPGNVELVADVVTEVIRRS